MIVAHRNSINRIAPGGAEERRFKSIAPPSKKPELSEKVKRMAKSRRAARQLPESYRYAKKKRTTAIRGGDSGGGGERGGISYSAKRRAEMEVEEKKKTSDMASALDVIRKSKEAKAAVGPPPALPQPSGISSKALSPSRTSLKKAKAKPTSPPPTSPPSQIIVVEGEEEEETDFPVIVSKKTPPLLKQVLQTNKPTVKELEDNREAIKKEFMKAIADQRPDILGDMGLTIKSSVIRQFNPSDSSKAFKLLFGLMKLRDYKNDRGVDVPIKYAKVLDQNFEQYGLGAPVAPPLPVSKKKSKKRAMTHIESLQASSSSNPRPMPMP